MRVLFLDFAARRRPAGPVGRVLLAAGVLVAVVVAGDLADAREEVARVAELRDQARRRLTALRPAAPATAAAAPDPRATIEANRVIARLAVPWPRLLAGSAAAAGADIALTGLNPDLDDRSLVVAGVAADFAAALAFAERLRAAPGFVDAHLVRHASAADGGVSFAVAARWSDAR